jgi:hypothetical protein
MKRPYFLATIGIAALSAASPAQAFPALVVGLIAAGAVGIAAASQEPASPEPRQVTSSAPRASVRRPPSEPAEDRDEVWDYTDKYGWVGGAPEHVSTINVPLAPKRGTSPRIVSACRDAVAKNAEAFDLASLEAVSAGRQARAKGRIVAPVEIRAVYKVRGVHEVKRSTVRCVVDRAGRVIATS